MRSMSAAEHNAEVARFRQEIETRKDGIEPSPRSLLLVPLPTMNRNGPVHYSLLAPWATEQRKGLP